MLVYTKKQAYTASEIFALYDSVGWKAYTDHLDQLMRGLEQSIYVETVYCDGELVGLLRAVGDGQTILYIQDILVHPKQAGKGIGSQLLKNVLDAYPDVRQKILLTENDPKTLQFYEKIGGININEFQLNAFMFE